MRDKLQRLLAHGCRLFDQLKIKGSKCEIQVIHAHRKVHATHATTDMTIVTTPLTTILTTMKAKTLSLQLVWLIFKIFLAAIVAAAIIALLGMLLSWVLSLPVVQGILPNDTQWLRDLLNTG